MTAYTLNFGPAAGALNREDEELFHRVLNACSLATTHPAIREDYPYLVENLRTFGSCTVATALFIQARKQKGENWFPLLVEDTEFPEDHVLRTHWVASNGHDILDVTVGDKEKTVRALGTEAEKVEINKYLNSSDFLKRLEAGLRDYRDEDGKPLSVTASALLKSVYQDGVLSKPANLPRNVRVVPMAIFRR